MSTAFSIDLFEIAGRDNSGDNRLKTETSKQEVEEMYYPAPIPHMKALDPVGRAAGCTKVAKMAACSFCLGAMPDIPLNGEISAFEFLRRNLSSVDIDVLVVYRRLRALW